MKVTCVHWNKNSHKLFDYESCELIHNTIELNDPFVLNLQNFFPDLQKIELLNVEKNETGFRVLPAGTSKIWKILSQEFNFQLVPGQYLKFGRKMFRVRSKDLKPNYSALKPLLSYQQETCRICFQQKTAQDPLISPCNCKGSIKFAHFTCFSSFIKPFVQIQKSENLTKFTVKKMICEISKCQIHKKILKKSLIFGFLNNLTFTKPYLVLDFFDCSKEYSVIIVELEESQEIVIGRSSDAGFCVPDISVSRNQAVLKVINGEFWVKDCGSRFGSLISLKKLALNTEENVQVGNCVLHFMPTPQDPLKI